MFWQKKQLPCILFKPCYKKLFTDFQNESEFVIVIEAKNGLTTHTTLVFIKKVIHEYTNETVDLIVKGSGIIAVKSFHEKYSKKMYSAVDANKKDNVSDDISAGLLFYFNNYLEKLSKKTSNKAETIF